MFSYEQMKEAFKKNGYNVVTIEEIGDIHFKAKCVEDYSDTFYGIYNKNDGITFVCYTEEELPNNYKNNIYNNYDVNIRNIYKNYNANIYSIYNSYNANICKIYNDYNNYCNIHHY